MDPLRLELRLASLEAAASLGACPISSPSERAAEVVTEANAFYWWLTGPHRAVRAEVRITNITSKNN
jgi:hypothetical protein